MSNAQVWASIGVLAAMPVAFVVVQEVVRREFRKLREEVGQAAGEARRLGRSS